MQVRVKTPHTRVEIEGDIIPPDLLNAVKRVFSEDEIEILEGDDEYVDWFETDLHKQIETETTPGDVIRIYRTNRNWTQARLGEELGGVPKQHISNMERGLRPVSPGMAIKLSQVFDVPVERFLQS